MQEEVPNFDASANSYDETFTHSSVGVFQRKQVYRLLDGMDFFTNTKAVFEINCGTGYDAERIHNKGIKVFATDISKGMIEDALNKRSTDIQFEVMDCKNTHLHPSFLKSDTLFSNFGGLNCLSPEELRVFVKNIANTQKSGDQIAWVIMPKICMVESFYFLWKGSFSKMFRRNTNRALLVNVDGVAIPTYYHSPKALKKTLKEDYELQLVQTVAFFIPPSYMSNLFSKHSKLLKLLYKCDQYLGKLLPAAWSDHFMIVGKRK